ncbi:MAG: polymer-forming cytoskeletal protein [Candidatus Zixiibacteriota bacterium]
MSDLSKLTSRVCFLSLTFVFLIWNSSFGTQFKAVGNFFFPDTAVIQDDLVISGRNIKLDGIVEGDLISASQSLVQNGLVIGSLNSACQDLDILGEVRGSVRGLAQIINVNGKLGRNLIAIGATVDIKPGAEIEKDAAVFCGKMTLYGKVGGSLKGSVGELVMSGVVNGDVSVKAERITLMPTAKILGDFRYKSEQPAKIESGALVSGETVWTKVEKKEHKSSSIYTGESLLKETLFLLALMLTGIVMTLFRKRNAYQAKQAVGNSFLKSLGLGFVFMVCIPIAIVILVVTIIGIPIALISLLGYALLVYLAKIPVATFLGDKIIRTLGKQGEPSMIWSMVLGLVILTLLLNVPYLEWPLYFLVLFTGFGAILTSERSPAS